MVLYIPFLNIPFRGVVWYQGESDVDIRGEYKSLMKSLIKDWRNAYSDAEMPFYIVELADFLHPDDKYGRKSWQEMRDAQRAAADETDRAWWIKNGDIGSGTTFIQGIRRRPARGWRRRFSAPIPKINNYARF